MTDFYDLCLTEASDDIAEKAEELGWTLTNCSLNTVFLQADDWGELKRKIGEKREKADILVFRGGNEQLNRKASEDSRVDILLHPGKGRKDSGVDQVIAENAAENRVAIGFDLRKLFENNKKRSQILSSWRKALKLCEKYETPYIMTSGAEDVYGLRAPRDLASVIGSVGYNGRKAVSEYPGELVERSRKAKSQSSVRPGVEEIGDEK